MLVLAELVVILLVHSLSAATDTGLITPRYASCTCPGEILVFTCTVVVDSRSGATIWKGSAFECAGNEITLIHSDFVGGTSRECNGGAITGWSIDVNGTRYTSQLNVTIYSTLNNKTVVCYLDSAMRQEIGASLIRVADACSEVQPDVDLVEVHSGQLTFSWPQLASACSPVQYVITSQTGCGNCSISADTSAICSDLHLSTTEKNCTFGIRSTVRGFAGTPSNPITATLKVPDVPQVNLIPIYFNTTQTLIKVTAEISTMDSFSIYEGVSGSAVNYTIHFLSNANKTIPIMDSICEYTVPVPTTVCPSSSGASMVRVSAANRLGSGPPSEPVSLECTNRFVTVDISSTASTFTCLFQNSINSVEKTCSVTYTICNQKETSDYSEGNSTSEFPDRVVLHIHLPGGSNCYMYTVRASNGTSTVVVIGKIDSVKGHSSAVITVAIVVPIIGIAIIVIIAILVASTVLYRRKHLPSNDRIDAGKIVNISDVNDAAAEDTKEVEPLSDYNVEYSPEDIVDDDTAID